MCGLCGYLTADAGAFDVDGLRPMAEAIAHRGPDGHGELELGSAAAGGGLRVWFGHRRLRIIDLSQAAAQPMVNEDATVALTYNGEIYNFGALRAELARLGFAFRSSGDTEVVLRAYEAWGLDFVQRLDGMFALAIWDGRHRRLVLARDRVGKKPLYYASTPNGIAFGSEIKSVLACPWVPREPDWSRLGEMLIFGYAPCPATMYRNVMQVPPASLVVFDRAGTKPPQRYWSALPNRATKSRLGGGPGASFYEGVARRLREATRKRMVADVPLGALLSGGVDSSIVVGLMAEVLDEQVRTFSIGFPEESSYDERPHARQIAERFGTRHTEFAVEMNAIALIDRLLWHYDQPFADSSAVPTYVVSELARSQVTVVLNGDGGDEVFGGYDRFAAAALSWPLPTRLAGLARRAAGALPGSEGYYSLRRRGQRFLERADAPVKDRYQGWISVFPPETVRGLVRPDITVDEDELTASMLRQYACAQGLPDLDQILFANLTTYLPDDLAVKMDRMSMAHGLETRSPFLDTALIEHLATVRARFKVGLRTLKPVLRRALFDLLPPEIWNRKKHGFGVPLRQWFAGELGTVFVDEVLALGARCASVLDAGAVARLWREHASGEHEHSARLWTILMLERWLRTLEAPLCIEPPPAPIQGADELVVPS